MKIIVTQRLDQSYRLCIQNGAGQMVELDSQAYRGIHQRSEAKAAANALRVAIGCEVIWED